MTAAQIRADDNRQAERFRLVLPVQIGEERGQTRDISVSGIYFETDDTFAPGSEVDFSVDLEHVRPIRPVRLVCKGRIVRVERKDGKVGVAVAVDSHRFETVSGLI